jgi:hypothetical protein
MLRSFATLIAAIAIVSSSIYAASETQVTRDPAAVKQVFKEITARLDEGGDLFVVANMDGLVEKYVGYATQFASLAPVAPAGPMGSPAQLAEKVSTFLKENGFYAVKGVGLSVVPRTDGLNTVKMFTCRDPKAALLPLWRGTVGTRPSRMGCLSYMPKDSVMVRSGTADLSALWTLIKSGITEIGGATAEQSLTQQLAMAEQAGVSVDAILKSLLPEGAVSIQLSTTATSTIPAGPTTMEIPTPSMLIVTRVADDTILDTIKKLFGTTIPMPLTETSVGGNTLYSIPIPLPSPVPVQITLARHGQYLLIGSTTEVVSNAIAAAGKGNGLVSLPEFANAFSGAHTNCNGIMFVSARLGETMADVQGTIMEKSMAGTPNAKASLGLTREWMESQCRSTEALTIVNYRSGVKVAGRTSSGGHELMASVMVAPIGMLAAIAIPSFVKARSTSQQNACINNLRQLDAAKEQWAMASNSAAGAIPVEKEALQYIRGAAMPICPQGGSYTLNVIGVTPTCSHPGHAMR